MTVVTACMVLSKMSSPVFVNATISDALPLLLREQMPFSVPQE